VELRAKLLLPLLTPKAKSLISRSDATALADVKQIKAFLLNEFCLTSREYRARFNAAVRGDETYALFTSRLKNLWGFYMHSCECDDFDKLVDLIVADRLKNVLSGPCLKYCLAIEGNKILHSEELAALADTFDANYTPEGRYRGCMINTFKEGNTHTSKIGVGNERTRTVPSYPPLTPLLPPPVTRVPRKCWICSSTSHMKKRLPRGS